MGRGTTGTTPSCLQPARGRLILARQTQSIGRAFCFALLAHFLDISETVPEAQSQWQGQCFVFDERVSVGHGLAEGNLELCRSCRDPLIASAKASPLYERGVSCPGCHSKTSDAQKAGYRQRQKQVDLAEARQQSHIGALQKTLKIGS